jgi:nicotinate-nucleotide pyrophosphorylase (carboxylating)
VPTAEPRAGLDGLVRHTLREDRARRDRTTGLLFARSVAAEGRVTAQRRGVLSGIEAARATARALGLRVVTARRDGTRVEPGTEVLRLRGDARRILSGERTLLNFLMHASGVATETRRAVDAAAAMRQGSRTAASPPGSDTYAKCAARSKPW